MSPYIQPDESYWKDYDGLQHVKHQLLKEYLKAWFPILARYNGKILYIDTHAGRGKHRGGQEGSPLVAVNTLINHKYRESILTNSEVHFFFFEYNAENCKSLEAEIEKVGHVPERINIHPPICSDFEKELRDTLNDLDEEGVNLAPTFAFIDPYGFGIPLSLINKILSYKKCEVFLTFMFRGVHMAMTNPVHPGNIDSIFGSDKWKNILNMTTYEEKKEYICDIYAEQLNAQFVSMVKMLGKNKALKYVLFHATNHSKGWWKMKDAIWSVIPDGSFSAYEKDRPEQLVLLVPEPELHAFEKEIRSKLSMKAIHYTELINWMEVTKSPYRDKHLNDVIKKMKKNRMVECSDYEGRFGFEKNPLIRLREKDVPQLFD